MSEFILKLVGAQVSSAFKRARTKTVLDIKELLSPHGINQKTDNAFWSVQYARVSAFRNQSRFKPGNNNR